MSHDYEDFEDEFEENDPEDEEFEDDDIEELLDLASARGDLIEAAYVQAYGPCILRLVKDALRLKRQEKQKRRCATQQPQKERNKMFNNMFNGMFGMVEPGLCRLSMSGNIAVKTSGGYKSYNVKTGRLTNCNGFCFNVGEEFFFVVPTNKAEVGDILLINGKPKCVTQINKKTITVLDYEDSSIKEIVPERHVFMGSTYFYGKIVSMFGNMKDGKGMKNMMKMMMMSSMFNHMNGGGASGGGSRSPMLPAGGAAAGMANMLPMMMMFGGGGNGGMGDIFENMFSFGSEDEDNDVSVSVEQDEDED